MEARQYAYFVGIDWATELHQVSVLDGEGKVLDEFKVRHDGEAMAAFAMRLTELCGSAERIAVAIEAPRGAIIEILLERDVAVFSINPKQLDRFRDRHTVAGAKDDRRDAFVLADSLRTDLKLFRKVTLGDPILVELREMTRAHDELTSDALALANRVRELLHRYFPQFLELGSLHEELWLLQLFELAPTPERAKHLQRAKVDAILRRHRIRRLDADQVVTLLKRKPLPVAPGVAAAAAAHVTLLLPRLKAAVEQRGACYDRIEQLMATVGEAVGDEGAPPGPKRQHRDAEILLSLPGVGILTSATMLAEATTALARRDYQSLRTQCGLAPVSHQTGKQRRPTVSMRHACNPRLRNATYHWARVSMQRDPKTREHYARLRASGHSHGRALRGVADRLLAVAVAMLKSDTTYDASRRHPVTASGSPGAGTSPADPALATLS
jgi:transposase